MTVRDVPDAHAEPVPARRGTSWVLTVHGGDRAGIVSAVVGRVADGRRQHHRPHHPPAGDLYLLVAEIDLPADADAAALERAIGRGRRPGSACGATLRAVEADEL